MLTAFPAIQWCDSKVQRGNTCLSWKCQTFQSIESTYLWFSEIKLQKNAMMKKIKQDKVFKMIIKIKSQIILRHEFPEFANLIVDFW